MPETLERRGGTSSGNGRKFEQSWSHADAVADGTSNMRRALESVPIEVEHNDEPRLVWRELRGARTFLLSETKYVAMTKLRTRRHP